MGDTFTATYDLSLGLRKMPMLDADSITRAVADLGFRIEMPPTARLDRYEYVPVSIFLDDAIVRTGLTLGKSDASHVDALAPGQVAELSIWAKNAPIPGDAHEVPLAWIIAAALARAWDGIVHDPQEGRTLDAEEARAEVENVKDLLDATMAAWDDYAYDLFRCARDGDDVGVLHELDRGARIDARDSVGNTALLLALRPGGSARVARALLARGASLAVENRYEKTVLDGAVALGDRALLRELVAGGAAQRPIALRFAASGDTATLGELLDAGIDLDLATPKGWTLLMVAIYEHRVETATMLLERGASMKRVNADGVTALMVAVDQGIRELVESMLERGADLDHRAEDGRTALDWATSKGDRAIVALLRRAARKPRPPRKRHKP